MSVLLSASCPLLLSTFVQAQNSTSSGGTDNTQKALITVGVLGGCILIAIIVAKIVDYCYDHHVAISDDASDISEHTRNLIRSRLAVTAFRGKRKPAAESAPNEVSAKQRKIIRIWSAKAKESRKIAEQRRAQDQAKALAARADLIIRVEEASGEAKLQASQAAPSATLTFLSETSDQEAGPSEDKKDKGVSKGKSKFQVRPEVKRTLSGLDSSAKIAEAPAVVAVSASGNTSVLPGKGGTSSVIPVKEGTALSSSKEQTVPASDDAVDSFRSGHEGDPATQAKGSDPSGGSKLAESKSQRSTTPKPGGTISKSQSPRSPTPQPKTPDLSKPKTEESKSPNPNTPAPKSKSPDLSKPKTEGSKSPSPNTPAPKSKSPDLSKPKTEGSKSPGPYSPTPKSKSPDPYKSKSEIVIPPSRPVNRSPSPPNKPAKQTAQNRAASPTKLSTDTKKTDPSQEKGAKAPDRGTSTANPGAKPVPAQTPVEEVLPKADKPDSSPSPARSRQSRPTSSRQLFTVVSPTDQSTKAKTSTPRTDSKPAPSSPGKSGAVDKPRPKSFHGKDGDKFSHMPPKLAGSVALYGKATNDLDKHKALVSKRKAAASPTRAANQSPPPGKKLEQSPIVLAAAARRARAKSAKR